MSSKLEIISDGQSNIEIFRHYQTGTDIPAGAGNSMTFQHPIQIHHLRKPTIVIGFDTGTSTNFDVDLLPINPEMSVPVALNEYNLGTAFTTFGRTAHFLSATPGFFPFEVIFWGAYIRITNQDAANALTGLTLDAFGANFQQSI